jgi:hypothetical protein
MTPDIVNGDPTLTDVGGLIMRFLVTVRVIDCDADAARSHDASVNTRIVTDLPINTGSAYVPSTAVTPVVKVRTVPSA